MFKRSIKVTALLVGVAAITSIFSSVSAEAITRLENKEGKIENAVANYGRYIYDGYKEDNTSDIYVSDGNEDKAVEGVDDYLGNYNIKCGDKYVFTFKDGETYLTDIASGTIVDNTTVEDTIEGFEKSLRKKVKSTDRYGKRVKIKPLLWLRTSSFGELWYKYTAVISDDAKKDNDATVNNEELYGFVSSNGAYVDASCKANITVVSNEGKTVKLDEFGKEENGVTANLIDIYPIAQDKDYIYTITMAYISGACEEMSGSQIFIQKISKASDEKKDGANIPNTVNSYMATTVVDGDDDDKALNVIANDGITGLQELASFFLGNSYKKSGFTAFNPYRDCFTVVNGVLYFVKNKGTEVQVTKFNMKKEKAQVGEDSNNKFDLYTVKFDDDETHDITKGSNISIDALGKVWGINKGKIFKFEDLKTSDVYTCDTSFNKLDVFNDVNLVVWNTDEESYATFLTSPEAVMAMTKATDTKKDEVKENIAEENEASKSEVKENVSEDINDEIGKKSNKPETNNVTSGWVQNEGKWYFKNADGTNKIGWYSESNNWYYFTENGEMATGFATIGGKSYYFNQKSDGTQGVMKKGWENINGAWYYFNTANDMNISEGMMLTGWRNINNTWYYFYDNGTMASNTNINGYYVNNSGAWVK